MLYIKNKVHLCIEDFIIFGEERQVEVYGKGLAPIRNMMLFVMHVQYARLIWLFELIESCAMDMMIWNNVIFLLMVGTQDTKYV